MTMPDTVVKVDRATRAVVKVVVQGPQGASYSGGGGGDVSSVFGRTGAVLAVAGDYTAAKITNTPAGNIAATNVQTALNELDSEKEATGTAAAAITAHVALSDPHTQYALESSLGAAALLGVGTTAGTVAAGNHTHSDATTGAAGFMSSTDKTKLDGIAAGAEVNVNADWSSSGGDSQILNKPSSITPTAHATSHQSLGTDAIKLDDLAAPDDNTDLDATTNKHGLLPKLGGGTTNFLRADGTWQTPAGGGDMSNPMTTAGDMIYGGASGTPARLPIGSSGYVLKVSGSSPTWAAESGGTSVSPSSVTPADLGTAAIGSSTYYARADHVHKEPTFDELDIASAAQGDLLYRGASAWARLGAGTSGHFLKTLGAGADPAWAAALANPMTTAGDLIVGGASGAAERFSPFGIYLNEPFLLIYASATDRFASGVSGAGAAVGSSGVSDSTHPGVWYISTGTATTGYAYSILGPSSADTIVFGGYAVEAFMRIKIGNLSDGTETYALRIGFGDSTAADFTDGVYFQHDSTTGDWIGKTSNGSSRTTASGGTAVAAAADWQDVRISVNAAGNLATFYVWSGGAWVSIGTCATNIPTTNKCAWMWHVVKSAGTTARLVYIDHLTIVAK